MPALDSLPAKIGPYRLLDKIGEGGMGVVYLARDAENRPVAVKVLGPAVAGEPSARARLSREVETMRRVRAPNVAEVLDADIRGPSPYVVTRYVPGRPLDAAVREMGPLRGVALQRLAVGLARALSAIHAAGVVHRDLKPGNVMLLDNGEPVVIDFGIAQAPDATKLTQTGIVMGTPGYLAPEVIEGEPSSGASDVHSWGATMAFAATGRQPYGAGSFQTIFYRVLHGKADLAGMPAALLPLVAAALAPDPVGRPTAVWLAGHCAALDLMASPPVVRSGPGGTWVLPDEFEPSRAAFAPARSGAPVPRGPAVPAGPVAYMAPGPPLPPVARPPMANGTMAAGRGLMASRPLPPPGPAEAAADVADLLPPVSYRGPSNGTNGLLAPRGAGSSRPVSVQPGMPPGSVPSGNGARSAQPTAGVGLVSLALGVLAVALSIALPVAGTIVALAAITLLRAADKAQTGLETRRSVRGARPSDVLVVIVTAPWTVASALLTTVALVPLAFVVAVLAAVASVLIGHTTSLPDAGSWAAGAAVAWSAVGPGSRRPRRQLRRMFAGVLRTPAGMVVGIIVSWSLAAAAVSSALSQPPLLWPATTWMMPHVPSLGSSLHAVQQWLLRRAVRVLHMP